MKQLVSNPMKVCRSPFNGLFFLIFPNSSRIVDQFFIFKNPEAIKIPRKTSNFGTIFGKSDSCFSVIIS